MAHYLINDHFLEIAHWISYQMNWLLNIKQQMVINGIILEYKIWGALKTCQLTWLPFENMWSHFLDSAMFPDVINLFPWQEGQTPAMLCYASCYIGFIHIYNTICDVDAVTLDLTVISNKSITE